MRYLYYIHIYKHWKWHQMKNLKWQYPFSSWWTCFELLLSLLYFQLFEMVFIFRKKKKIFKSPFPLMLSVHTSHIVILLNNILWLSCFTHFSIYEHYLVMCCCWCFFIFFSAMHYLWVLLFNFFFLFAHNVCFVI